MTDKYINYLTDRVIETRSYIERCIAERELYEADKAKYKAEYWERLKDDLDWRDRVSIAIQVVDQGIRATLFDYVENIALDDECKLASALGLPDDQPFKPFVDNYLNEVQP